MKRIASTLAVFALAATPVLAGNASMKGANGDKVWIKCKNSGCVVQTKPKGGKMTTKKYPGGRDNFLKLEAKYKAEGYK